VDETGRKGEMMEPVQLLGILVLLALLLGMAAKLRSSKSVDDLLEEADAGDLAGRSDDPPAPDAEESSGEGTLCGPEGERLIQATARTIIADEAELARWCEFDRVFLDRCLRKTPHGLVFDGEAFAALEPEAEESLVRFGVAIYNACGKAAMESLSTQQKVFGRIAQIYLAALMTFRG
jgi:hypothetical protein